MKHRNFTWIRVYATDMRERLQDFEEQNYLDRCSCKQPSTFQKSIIYVSQDFAKKSSSSTYNMENEITLRLKFHQFTHQF